jgi:hypothetical protein
MGHSDDKDVALARLGDFVVEIEFKSHASNQDLATVNNSVEASNCLFCGKVNNWKLVVNV